MCPLARLAVAVNRAVAEPPLLLTWPRCSRILRWPRSVAACRSGVASPDWGTFTLILSMAG